MSDDETTDTGADGYEQGDPRRLWSYNHEVLGVFKNMSDAEVRAALVEYQRVEAEVIPPIAREVARHEDRIQALTDLYTSTIEYAGSVPLPPDFLEEFRREVECCYAANARLREHANAPQMAYRAKQELIRRGVW